MSADSERIHDAYMPVHYYPQFVSRDKKDMRKSLEEMMAEVVTFCEEKGWRDVPVSFGEAMALLHSEVSEALEAWRLWGTEDPPMLNLPEGKMGKPEGVGSEFADVLIRLLDDCERFGVDLEAEYERKMAYNRTRPYRHGKRS